jgi:hypothetical protein
MFCLYHGLPPGVAAVVGPALVAEPLPVLVSLGLLVATSFFHGFANASLFAVNFVVNLPF